MVHSISSMSNKWEITGGNAIIVAISNCHNSKLYAQKLSRFSIWKNEYQLLSKVFYKIYVNSEWKALICYVTQKNQVLYLIDIVVYQDMVTLSSSLESFLSQIH